MFSAMKRPLIFALAFLCGCAPRPLKNVTFVVVKVK